MYFHELNEFFVIFQIMLETGHLRQNIEFTFFYINVNSIR